MRRAKVTNPKELSRAAKFYALLTVPDLLLIFITMIIASLVNSSPVMITLLVITLISLRKYLNRKHNTDLIESYLKNKKHIFWFESFKNIKKG